MDALKIKDCVVHALEELKAEKINVLDIHDYCDFTDFMVICSGTSNRHVRSLANNVFNEAKKHHLMPRIEGEDEAEWVLIDLGDVVVHVMQRQTRDFYQLDELWEVPV